MCTMAFPFWELGASLCLKCDIESRTVKPELAASTLRLGEPRSYQAYNAEARWQSAPCAPAQRAEGEAS